MKHQQSRQLRLLGICILTLALTLEGLSLGIQYWSVDEESLFYCLTYFDGTSLTMMALLFTIMALFCFGGSRHKQRQY